MNNKFYNFICWFFGGSNSHNVQNMIIRQKNTIAIETHILNNHFKFANVQKHIYNHIKVII